MLILFKFHKTQVIYTSILLLKSRLKNELIKITFNQIQFLKHFYEYFHYHIYNLCAAKIGKAKSLGKISIDIPLLAILIGLAGLIDAEDYSNYKYIFSDFDNNQFAENKKPVNSFVSRPIEIQVEHEDHEWIEGSDWTEKNEQAENVLEFLSNGAFTVAANKDPQDNIMTKTDNEVIEAEFKRAGYYQNINNYNAGVYIFRHLAYKYPHFHKILYHKIKMLSVKGLFYQNKTMLNALAHICSIFGDINKLFSDDEFRTMITFCINQMKLIDKTLLQIHLQLILIKRFDENPQDRIDVARLLLKVKDVLKAKELLEDNLKRWPNNGTSLACYGHILHLMNNTEDAIHYLKLGIESNEKGTDLRFYYIMLGHALMDLNRKNEARKIFRKAVTKNLLINEYQWPHVSIKNLKAQPIWTKEETPYTDILNLFELNWKRIRDDGINMLNENNGFYGEVENLTVRGSWKELYLISNDHKKTIYCDQVKFTCNLIDQFYAKHISLNGQVKYSVIYPGTYIRNHLGLSNTRIRAQLGLKIPNGTRIRIAGNDRIWEEGKFLIIDDSFEHEVFHTGNSLRLLFIIDFWHPQLTDEQKTNYYRLLDMYENNKYI